MNASETSPLLHTPTAVSQRHRLGPPAIRFPGHNETSGFERQQSYGFSGGVSDDHSPSDASASDATLVSPADRQRGYGKRPYDPRREDSKVYTSFPVPTGTPWREAGSPSDQHEYPFFSRLFGGKANVHDRQNYPYIQDEENALGERQPGLPKVTRECLIAEIKCYGSYILPTFLVFVVLVLVVALGIFYHYNN